MTTTPKSREDLQTDAVILHGILQGLNILQNETSEAGPLLNAIHALTHDAMVKAQALSTNLDSVNAPKAGDA